MTSRFRRQNTGCEHLREASRHTSSRNMAPLFRFVDLMRLYHRHFMSFGRTFASLPQPISRAAASKMSIRLVKMRFNDFANTSTLKRWRHRVPACLSLPFTIEGPLSCLRVSSLKYFERLRIFFLLLSFRPFTDAWRYDIDIGQLPWAFHDGVSISLRREARPLRAAAYARLKRCLRFHTICVLHFSRAMATERPLHYRADTPRPRAAGWWGATWGSGAFHTGFGALM